MSEFDWDAENLQHIAEHGITAEEVEFMMDNGTQEINYQDWHESEERFSEVGVTAAGRIIVVVTTMRGTRLRVVTAFDAPKRAAEAYLRGR